MFKSNSAARRRRQFQRATTWSCPCAAAKLTFQAAKASFTQFSSLPACKVRGISLSSHDCASFAHRIAKQVGWRRVGNYSPHWHTLHHAANALAGRVPVWPASCEQEICHTVALISWGKKSASRDATAPERDNESMNGTPGADATRLAKTGVGVRQRSHFGKHPMQLWITEEDSPS